MQINEQNSSLARDNLMNLIQQDPIDIYSYKKNIYFKTK